MRVLIAAVGRLKQGPERELAERYRKRATDVGRMIGWQTCDIIEIRDSRAENPEQRRLGGPPAGLAGRRRPAAIFIVGGADGLAASLREKADLALSFGALTW